jgi:hypothetical protein
VKAGVHLGFEVGTGAPVEIPLAHTFVTGQTQLSGKTTALRAIVDRSGCRALAFVTKRGETFDGRRIRPYLAARGRTANPLAPRRDGHGRVARAAEHEMGARRDRHRGKGRHHAGRGSRQRRQAAAKDEEPEGRSSTCSSVNTSIWCCRRCARSTRHELAAAAWPQRHGPHRRRYADAGDGDPRGARAHQPHEKGVLTVFPEAWEFAPRGRSAPAKDEAIAMARKGAVLGNFLLCDSQDLAGVDTVVRQAASVWLLGVQRELNELKRTLQMIPAGVKRPKPEDVAQLELGQFYVCWGRHAIKTYVQPTWIESEIAVWVATGRITADSTSICQEAKHRRMKDAVDRLVRKTEEDQVNAAEAGALRDENARLARDNEELRRRLTVLERSDPTRAASDGVRGREETERSVPGRGSRALEPSARGSQHVDEALYQAIKARLIEEAPGILVQLRASRPELEVTVTRKTLTLDEFSLKGRIARLLKEGFFAEPRGCGAVRSALKRTGPDANTANIGRALDEFTRDGFVTDEGSGYREVLGMKVNIVEGA